MKREALIKLVELQLGRRGVKLEDRFFEDLGAESVDIVNLVATVEERTGIFIPEEVIPDLKTTGDLENFILKHKDES